MPSHKESVEQVLKTIDIYYEQYSKMWLTPVKDNPVQNEKNRITRMGMKILRDLVYKHYDKELVNAK